MKTHKLMKMLYVLSLAGCISADPNAVLSTVRVEPLGPGQFMISCVDSPKYCAQQAVKSCPDKFDVISNTTNPADYGRMTMIIRCE